MGLPDFAIVGAMKAGTTSVADTLRTHPDLYLPHSKEPHYYSDRETEWVFGDGRRRAMDYGIATEDGYRALFAQAQGRLTGEASVQYLPDPVAARRLADANPACKIILILRDPVARAYSAYNYVHAKGGDRSSFEDAVEQEMRGERDGHFYEYRYLHHGLYHRHLETWLAHFPAEQFLVCDFARLRDPGFYDHIARFLGVSDFPRAGETEANQSFVPRSGIDRWVWSLVETESWPKRILARALPHETLRYCKEAVRSGLARRGVRPAPLSADMSARLRTHFSEDQARLADRLARGDLRYVG